MAIKHVLGLAAGAAAAFSAALTGAAAQQALTLDDVLRQMRAEARETSQENRERERRFLAERNNQRAELQRVRQQIDEQEAISTELETTFNDNQREIDELTQQFNERQGEFGELFGAARSAANELKAEVERSLVSAEFPGRAAKLEEIAQTKKLPTEDQLIYLYETLLQEAVEQSKVSTFTSDVFETDGNKVAGASVTRIGPFTAFIGGDFVVYNENGALSVLARQPAGEFQGLAANIANSNGGIEKGVIDPSLGTLLSLVVDAPTLRERVDQGGNIGYAVIIALILGLVIGVYKWVTLTLTQMAVAGQARSKKASKGNPLGRIMLAYEANQNADPETLQLKLEDAVLKELPKLEGGLNFVKVLAAVAPLMGLLGTVTGMIRTFQAITLFGAGDPKLMAGGISEALVTTALGLIAAIPLLLLHAFASGASRRTAQILEEQSIGLVADRADR